MVETPHKFESASRRRRPTTLRAPSGPRRPSNPHLSLIFAQGGSTLSGNELSTSKRPGTHSSLSEEALFRQLDGDLGGKQMGLRSRRSSNGTVQTVHTAARGRSPSPSHSVAEVAEEDEAGPSSNQLSNSLVPSEPYPISDTRSGPSQPLNPKSTTSWLRWNSPSSSFPQAGPETGKGKGKIPNAVEEKELVPRLANSADLASFEPPPDPLPCSISASQVVEDHQPSPLSPRPPDLGKEDGIQAVPPSSQSRGRGWWGRKPSITTSKEKGEQPPGRRGKELNYPNNDNTSSRPSPPDTTYLAGSKPPSAVPTTPDTFPKPVSPAQTAIQTSTDQTQRGRWQDYLWRSEGKNPAEKSLAEPPSDIRGINGLPYHGFLVPSESTPNKSASGDSSQVPAPKLSAPSASSAPLALSASTLPSEAPETSLPASSVLPRPSSSSDTLTIPGWSSYLYSFVVPPRPSNNASSPSPPHFIEPTSSSTDQKPVSAETSSTFIETAPVESGNIDTLKLQSPPPTRQPANTPSSGWLNYLALGSGQRKLPSNSVQSTNSCETAIPIDGAHEELMDFSGDPEFPSTTTLSSTNPDDRSQAITAKKASQALAVRKERKSFSSIRSGGSTTPLSSSPQTQSLLDLKVSSATVHSKIPFSATPQQTQGAQPNFVIPTFAASFDRPPRSLAPVSPLSSPDTSSRSTGITAATTGMAWKAIGAVGGYVYGGVSESALPASESQMGNEKESRGRKDGREVGGDLPRRIGLLSGSEDDGWKRVRRVVVVGVHGWFPAKMMNSLVNISDNGDPD